MYSNTHSELESDNVNNSEAARSLHIKACWTHPRVLSGSSLLLGEGMDGQRPQSKGSLGHHRAHSGRVGSDGSQKAIPNEGTRACALVASSSQVAWRRPELAAAPRLPASEDASVDQRSERLRRPALELAAALAGDAAPGGGREVLSRGLEVPPPGRVGLAWACACVRLCACMPSPELDRPCACLAMAAGGTSAAIVRRILAVAISSTLFVGGRLPQAGAGVVADVPAAGARVVVPAPHRLRPGRRRGIAAGASAGP